MIARNNREEYFISLGTLKIWAEVILSIQKINPIWIGDQSYLKVRVKPCGNSPVGSDS